MLIEFIETSSENISPKNLLDLTDWIIKKYNYFISKLDNSFDESSKLRHYYMIEKPFSRMESYVSKTVQFEKEIQNIVQSKHTFI